MTPRGDFGRAADPRHILDQLDQLRAAATPGTWGLDFNEWMVGACIALADDTSDQQITPEIGWNDAAVIVAAVNRLPDLTAAVRAALDLADELDGQAAAERREADYSAAGALEDAAESIRTTVTAELTEEHKP